MDFSNEQIKNLSDAFGRFLFAFLFASLSATDKNERDALSEMHEPLINIINSMKKLEGK